MTAIDWDALPTVVTIIAAPTAVVFFLAYALEAAFIRSDHKRGDLR